MVFTIFLININIHVKNAKNPIFGLLFLTFINKSFFFLKLDEKVPCYVPNIFKKFRLKILIFFILFGQYGSDVRTQLRLRRSIDSFLISCMWCSVRAELNCMVYFLIWICSISRGVSHKQHIGMPLVQYSVPQQTQARSHTC